MDNNNESWGTWLRGQFDKLLLVGLFLVLMVFLLHAIHDKLDGDHIHWIRETANTVMGTLLGLITGVRIGMSLAKQDPPK